MEIEQYHFKEVDNKDQLDHFKSKWRESLVAPQDDMWESFMNYATHWELKEKDQSIGYACSNDENGLLQFFLLPKWLEDAPAIFEKFIKEKKIKKATIGTNNPVCLSIALLHQKFLKVDTYLFTSYLGTNAIENDKQLRPTGPDELEKIVRFYNESMGAPTEWLNSYLGKLNNKGEVLVLEKGTEILAACEVRRSESDSKIANIGMVVSVHHRRKGLGTFMLSKAKDIAIGWGKQPICSCEKIMLAH